MEPFCPVLDKEISEGLAPWKILYALDLTMVVVVAIHSMN